MSKRFFEVFPTLKVNDNIGMLFQDVEVTKVATNKERDFIRVHILSRHLLDKKTVCASEESLKDQLFARSGVRVSIVERYEMSGQYTPENLMNALQKCIVLLYSYDENPDDVSVPNVLRQSLQLIAKMPMMAVYSYYAYRHFQLNKTLVVRPPKKELSTAENILYMLRKDRQYTELEACVLDIALVLHAEHGGGNNSTFTNHVVTSSGTDTYSAVAASVASLKGPKHGGANLKVQHMIADIKENKIS